MGYINDVNRLNNMVEHTPMRDANVNYSGLDYGHIIPYPVKMNTPLLDGLNLLISQLI